MVYAIESPLWRMIAAKQYAFLKKEVVVCLWAG